jgi:hypothetical protein
MSSISASYVCFASVTWFLPVQEGDKSLTDQENAYFVAYAEDLKQTLLAQLRDTNNKD